MTRGICCNRERPREKEIKVNSSERGRLENDPSSIDVNGSLSVDCDGVCVCGGCDVTEENGDDRTGPVRFCHNSNNKRTRRRVWDRGRSPATTAPLQMGERCKNPRPVETA